MDGSTDAAKEALASWAKNLSDEEIEGMASNAAKAMHQMTMFAVGLQKMQQCATTGLAQVTLTHDEVKGILYALQALRQDRK